MKNRRMGRFWAGLLGLCLICAIAVGEDTELLFETCTLPDLLESCAYHVNMELEEKRPVYSAPNETAFRAANGKASVSLNDDFSILGKTADDEWWMIEYEFAKEERRIGYIRAVDTEIGRQKSAWCGILPEPSVCAVTRRQTKLSDDFWGAEPREMAMLPEGQMLTVLSDYGPDWAYVETTAEGKTARGIVLHENIRMDGECRDEEAERMIVGKWLFAGGAEIVGDAVAFFADGTYINGWRDDLVPFGEETEQMGEAWIMEQLCNGLNRKVAEEKEREHWWITVDALGHWLWRMRKNTVGEEIVTCNNLTFYPDEAVGMTMHVGVDIGSGAMGGGGYVREEDYKAWQEKQEQNSGSWG